jgi:Bifunctional DNA primase/polymerase, N-terminal
MAGEIYRAARAYVAKGMPVIALSGKAPNAYVHRHGLKDAITADDGSLGEAMSDARTTGVGIVLQPGMIVVDIDGEEGAQQWLTLMGESNYLPESWVAKTGRGLHLYMGTLLAPNTMKLGPKLDLKGYGGYVVAPPSQHPVTGGFYEWLEPPYGHLPQAPEALEVQIAELLHERELRRAENVERRSRARKPLEDGQLYPVATFDSIIQRVCEEPEGNRNALLYWAARTVREDGGDPEDIEALGESAVESGLSLKEVKRTIRSALRAR